jgi:hypothetical protein
MLWYWCLGTSLAKRTTIRNLIKIGLSVLDLIHAHDGRWSHSTSHGVRMNTPYFSHYGLQLFLQACVSRLVSGLVSPLISNKQPQYLLQNRHSTGLFKKKYTLSKFYFTNLLMLNPCPVYGWKGNLSKFWYRLSEAAHHWGCGCCYLWHAATSVGRAV